MKILSIVPVLYDPTWTKLCLKHIKDDLIVIDNGSPDEVKKVIEPYDKIVNEKNIYVNPVWNQAMRIFIESDYDLLALVSSDVVLMHNWKKFVLNAWEEKTIILPNVIDAKPENLVLDFIMDKERTLIDEFAGIFLLLDRQMVNIVYPIPETIKIWFGDNWINNKLKEKGYKSYVYKYFYCVHGHSRSVSGLQNIGKNIIEQDKIEWSKLCMG